MFLINCCIYIHIYLYVHICGAGDQIQGLLHIRLVFYLVYRALVLYLISAVNIM